MLELLSASMHVDENAHDNWRQQEKIVYNMNNVKFRLPSENIIIERIVLISIIVTGAFFGGCSGTRPVTLGVKDGKLLPCPATPNCVSSQSSDKEHFIEPLKYTSSTAEAVADLRKIVQQMKRAVIVAETGNYLHVEFTSALWRFVDDVEFSFEEGAHVIQVRSASRVGNSDLGVNRKRVEKIRAQWNARMK
jgi:uncharacterized protein (DUF1499 family)